jgi:(4S)-4-hydroxy-5-phosphonooxypentane-2,3-dione isomerase
MPQVALLARVRAKQGQGAELIVAFRPVFELAEQEPGTLVYALNRSADDPDVFWVSELYADDEAFAAHRDSAAMAAATPALGELIAEAKVTIGKPVSAKGMPA